MKTKKLLVIFVLLLFGEILVMGANSKIFTFDENKKLWAGSYSIDSSTGHKQPPALKVNDNNKQGGIYAISATFPIKSGNKYQLSGWCKTDGTVTSGAVIYLRVLDSAGKTLKFFPTNQAKTTNWTRLQCLIPSKAIPAEAVSGRIMLQPARGMAKETGTAWFDDISLTIVKSLPLKPGLVEISRKIFIKELPSTMPVKVHGQTAFQTVSEKGNINSYAWELSWRNFRKLSNLLLKDDSADIKTLKLSYWNDAQQKWIAAGNFKTQEIPGTGYVEILLDSIPETRRMLIKFGHIPNITDLKLYVIPEIKENWKASWIWFTKKRVEHIKRFFRKSFTVNGNVDKAFFQAAGDDAAVFFVNGKRLISSSEWNLPVQCEVTKLLVQGDNIITAYVKQDRYAAGVIAEMDINYKSGKNQKIITDESWLSTDKPGKGWQNLKFDDSSWVRSKKLGVPPEGAWGAIPYNTHSVKKQIVLKNNPFPVNLRAGRTISAKFELQIKENIDKKLPIYFCMSRNGKIFIQEKINTINGILLNNSSGEAQLSVNIDLNSALYPGKYDFSLHIPYCSIVKSGKEWKQTVFIENQLKPQSLNTIIKKINGVPTMFINGTPYWSMFYTTISSFDLEQANHQAFADIGLKLVQCYVNPESPKEGEFDFTDIDRTVYEILKNNPDALIIMKPGFRECVLQWFLEKYPNEAAALDAGGRLPKPSLASLVWRKVAGDMLRNMIRHINNGPYADKVIGYFVREGAEGQWMHYWGGYDLNKDNMLSDYSLPMKNYFRIWLKNKYLNVESLQKAWHDDKVSFDTAEIPGKQERFLPQDGVFRNPAENRRAIDYAEALSDVICDGIIHYAKIVKEETHNRTLMLAFFGHIMDLGGFFLGEQVGYLKQRRVINCPDVDMLAGPISYGKTFRDIGGVASFDYPAPACLRLHNKIWLNEDDVRTHLVEPAGYAYSVRTPQQTDEVLSREFAKALCAGAGLYWLNLSAGRRYWFDDRQTILTIGRLNQIAQKAVKDNLSSVSEVAMIMSDKSLLYMRSLLPKNKDDGIIQQSIVYQREQIARLGAPVDEYLLDDFLNPAMPGYKLYIFLNAFYMTEQERKAVTDKLKKNNASALWFYAPGYITEKGLSLTAMSKLTGIKFDISSKRDDFKIKLIPSNPLLTGYRKNLGMAPGNTLKPLFSPVDDSVEIIGRLKSNDKPGFVVGKQAGFTSYYCSAPIVPAELLRVVAEKSGVHIYTRQDDAIYACKDYIAVHTSKNIGAREIVLPEACEMVQLYPEYKKFAKTSKLSFESKYPQTRIFKKGK